MEIHVGDLEKVWKLLEIARSQSRTGRTGRTGRCTGGWETELAQWPGGRRAVMGDPQVTMGFKAKSWSNDLDDLGTPISGNLGASDHQKSRVATPWSSITSWKTGWWFAIFAFFWRTLGTIIAIHLQPCFLDWNLQLDTRSPVERSGFPAFRVAGFEQNPDFSIPTLKKSPFFRAVLGMGGSVTCKL